MHVKGKQSTYKASQEKDWVTYVGYPTVPYIRLDYKYQVNIININCYFYFAVNDHFASQTFLLFLTLQYYSTHDEIAVAYPGSTFIEY